MAMNTRQLADHYAVPAWFICDCRNGCPRCHPSAYDTRDHVFDDATLVVLACSSCGSTDSSVTFVFEQDTVLCDACSEWECKPFNVDLSTLDL